MHRRWEQDGLVLPPDETAARWRAKGWWRDRTLLDDFTQIAAERPNSIAVVSHGVSGHIETTSYRRLRVLVERCAGGLVSLGVQPGEIVTVQLPNWWEFAVLSLACARVGAVVNPVVPIFRDREISFILERSRSRVCVVPESFRNFQHGEMMTRIMANLPDLEHVFTVRGTSQVAGTRSFEEFFLDRRWEEEIDRAVLDARAPEADDVALLMFTSGTTGEPKGVLHTYNTLFGASRANAEVLGLGPDDPILMMSTVGHGTGFFHGYVLPFSHGMPLVYQDVWDPAVMLDLIQDEGVVWTMAATPFVVDAIAEQRRRPRDLSTFRYFSCAGTPIPPHLVREAREVLGAELIAIWGMTENGVPTITRPGDAIEIVSDSDGQTVPWFEIAVVDPAGRPTPGAQIGQLRVRGAGQFAGYFRRRDLYDASVDAHGWFDTGDLARRRDDGGIRITGRSKDIIIRGGENIPVLEVEAFLLQHPAVAEVALVGYPDARLGERSCAVLVPNGEPPTLAEIQRHLASAGLVKQFWPERLEIVDELPKTAAGKIQKNRLRARIQQAE